MGTDNIMNRVKKLKRRLSLAFNKFPLTNGANSDQQQPHRTHNGKSSRGGIPYSASTSEGLNHICNGGEGDVGIEFSASSFTLNDADSVGAIQQLSDSISPVSHSDSYRSGHTNGSVGVNGHSETHAFGQSLYRLRSGGSSGAIGGDSKYLAREIQKSRRVHSVIALQESISELAERLEESSVGTHEEMSYEPKIIMRNKQKKAAEKVMRQSDSGYASQNGHAVSGNAEYSHARTYVRHSESSKSHLVSAYDRRHSLHGSKGAVVQEHPAIGSDGESIDGSYTSDEVTSPGRISSSSGIQVRMRPKPVRRFSEQDIQKRLSLPADLRLPLSVVEKLNRTPTLEQPLTRKNRRVSLHEIGFGKLESYQKLEKLGEGTYATVYRGRSRLTNNLVALKEIRLEHEEGAPCTAIREVSLLRDLRHANVVTLHDIIHTDQCLTLVFEYLERDLKQYMDECGNILSMNNVRLFLFQLLRGLAYCHARRVLHRDLKPQNLLINQKGELKLADFGLARAKSVPTKTYSNEVVTLWYRPPDVLLGSIDYSTHIDMWGVGCILYEMAAGRPFFPGSSADEQVHLIFRALGTPNPDLHPLICQSAEFKAYHFPQYRAEPLVNHAPRLDLDGLDLLAQLLQYEGRKRISARDALHHHFFAVFGLAVHKLPDTASIFTIPGIQLTRDPGYRPPRGFGDQIFSQNKNRRQSMLL